VVLRTGIVLDLEIPALDGWSGWPAVDSVAGRIRGPVGELAAHHRLAHNRPVCTGQSNQRRVISSPNPVRNAECCPRRTPRSRAVMTIPPPG